MDLDRRDRASINAWSPKQEHGVTRDGDNYNNFNYVHVSNSVSVSALKLYVFF